MQLEDFSLEQTEEDRTEAPNEVSMRSYRYVVNADQLRSLLPSDLNLPSFFAESFWTMNTQNQRLTTPSDNLFATYCPFLIGPCCSPVRRHDICRLLYSFTFWLILTQIALFVVTLNETASPFHNFVVDKNILIKYGAVTPEKIKGENELWRLLSSIVIHSSISHILCDFSLEIMFLLGQEASWNTLRTASIFILSSICGSFTTLSFSDRNVLGMGGCSGVFGVFGAFISLYLVMFDQLPWNHRIGALFLIMWVIILLILAGVEGSSDSWGLLGGVVFGFGFGCFLFGPKCQNHRQKLGFMITGIIISIVSMGGAIIFFYTQVSIP